MSKRKRRTFTPEFKASVVLEALSGESSQAELCRCHNLSEDQLSNWFSVKRISRQTTNSLEGQGPWVNRLEVLDICPGIRSGLAIEPTSDSKDASSLSRCSWMSSPE